MMEPGIGTLMSLTVWSARVMASIAPTLSEAFFTPQPQRISVSKNTLIQNLTRDALGL